MTYNKKHYSENKEWYKRRNHNDHRNLKQRVINHYGGKCACCKEDRIEFLAIDHIDGNGAKHRKEQNISSGSKTYLWLVKNKYPNGFRVLCHNCNIALGYYGYCPHGNVTVDKSQAIIIEEPKDYILEMF